MRIIILTAGTGSYYCGTCMRDNALATALHTFGHDVLLVPLYLPMMLDEPTAGEDAPMFYGGVNVYLQQVSFLFRKTPRWLDKMLDSPKVLKQAASRAGMTTPDQLGELTLSMLKGENGKQIKELDRLTEWLATDGKADVICLSNALLMGMAPRIKARTGAQVVCTLQGEDYFLESLPEQERKLCWEALRESAKDVDRFIAVSHYYGERMKGLAKLPEERVRVVHNGIRLQGYPKAPRQLEAIEVPTIGYLARLNPLKGLDSLVDAYIELRNRQRIPRVRLRIAGTKTNADDAYIEAQREKLEQAGYLGDVEILPNLPREEKIAFLEGLSLLSVPALYGESFGLYLLEAWAVGVPVVQPHHAAFPELVASTGGGVLYDPTDASALCLTLENLLSDANQLTALGNAGFQAVQERFTVEAMAKQFLDSLLP